MAGTNDRSIGIDDEKNSTIGTSDRHSTINCMDEGERDSPVFRESSERPILKLSVRLIDTYKNINKVSYRWKNVTDDACTHIKRS